MRRLVYWVARINDDHPAYSIRARTRKECKAQREANGPERFDAPRKVVVEYKDAFDIVEQALGEGGVEY